MARKVRIQSDGTAAGTTVTDAETGALIPDILEVRFNVKAGAPATVELVIAAPRVDLGAEAWFEVGCPACGRRSGTIQC